MNLVRSLLRPFFTLALAVGATATAQAQSPATGGIEGRVQDVATGDYLNNARVSVRGTNLVALTDDGGSYRLNAVPAGPVTLEIFFTGLDRQEQSLTVAAGQTARQDVRLTSRARYGDGSGTVKLDAFTVQSTR
jgi:hypothetical protein